MKINVVAFSLEYKCITMYRTLPNHEIRLPFIHMQIPLRKVLRLLIHTAHKHFIIIENFNVCEWLNKIKQNYLDGSVPARLDI